MIATIAPASLSPSLMPAADGAAPAAGGAGFATLVASLAPAAPAGPAGAGLEDIVADPLGRTVDAAVPVPVGPLAPALAPPPFAPLVNREPAAASSDEAEPDAPAEDDAADDAAPLAEAAAPAIAWTVAYSASTPAPAMPVTGGNDATITSATSSARPVARAQPDILPPVRVRDDGAGDLVSQGQPAGGADAAILPAQRPVRSLPGATPLSDASAGGVAPPAGSASVSVAAPMTFLADSPVAGANPDVPSDGVGSPVGPGLIAGGGASADAPRTAPSPGAAMPDQRLIDRLTVTTPTSDSIAINQQPGSRPDAGAGAVSGGMVALSPAIAATISERPLVVPATASASVIAGATAAAGAIAGDMAAAVPAPSVPLGADGAIAADIAAAVPLPASVVLADGTVTANMGAAAAGVRVPSGGAGAVASPDTGRVVAGASLPSGGQMSAGTIVADMATAAGASARSGRGMLAGTVAARGGAAVGGAPSGGIAGADAAAMPLDLGAIFPIAGNAPPLTVAFARAVTPRAAAEAGVPADPAAGVLPDGVAAGADLPGGSIASVDPALAPVLGSATMTGLAPAAAAAATTVSAAAPLAEVAMTHHLAVAHDGLWLDQLARDIAGSADADQRMRFQLAPDRLGALHVEIAGGADGSAVRFTTENEAARALLADAQPRLVAEARAHGMRITDTQVDLSQGQAGSGGQGGAAAGNPAGPGGGLGGGGQQQPGGQRAATERQAAMMTRSTRPAPAAGSAAQAERYA